MSEILQWDADLFVLLNQVWIHPFLDVAMPFLTDFDNWRIPVIGVLLFFLARGKTDTRLGILFAILAVVAADQISSSLLKPAFERLRPFHVIEGTRKLVGAHNYSFPSSHAANTFSAGVFLAMRFPKMRWILIVPFLISYTRVYVGVHYPLDVAGGALVGGICGASLFGLERLGRGPFVEWFRDRFRRESSNDEEDPS